MKYRAWTEDGRMIYGGFSIHATGKVETDGVEIGTKIKDIMLCLGRCDKNGKEIYQSDILLVPGYLDEPDKYVVEYGMMPFDGGCYQYMGFGFKGIGGHREYSEDCFMVNQSHEECEVVGDIYHNPELLIQPGIPPATTEAVPQP